MSKYKLLMRNSLTREYISTLAIPGKPVYQKYVNQGFEPICYLYFFNVINIKDEEWLEFNKITPNNK